ncbi:hypothetical protein C8Q70DRAFT_921950 [Cubamyces menziesii]|nr:hypothetical protein C8Q70DRAFT_921950 [Cubamyces menziesii]
MRHQVFLITRVRSLDGTSAYRCVAAYHHQWCYGRLPLIYLGRFIDLLSLEENNAIVREELFAMDGKYGHPSRDPSSPRCPCRYSLFLLATAWRVSHVLETETMYNMLTPLEGGFLDVRMGCWDGGSYT